MTYTSEDEGMNQKAMYMLQVLVILNSNEYPFHINIRGCIHLHCRNLKSVLVEDQHVVGVQIAATMLVNSSSLFI